MKTRLYAGIARGLYVLTFPITGMLLHNSRRVRVLVVYKNKILLQKSSVGTQKWSVPGGGIEKGEDPIAAAIRETKEETGVTLTEKNIKCLGEQRVSSRKRWPMVAMVFYVAKLDTMQEPVITRPLEILDVQWFSRSAVPAVHSKTLDIILSLQK